MSYIDTNGQFDYGGFVRDLAPLLGGSLGRDVGEMLAIKFDCDNNDTTHGIPGKLVLAIYPSNGHGKVAMTLYPDDIPFDFARGYGHGQSDIVLPRINVTATTRPMAQIVKDIQRRLFEPAREPIRIRRANAEQDRQYRAQTEAAANTIAAAVPALGIAETKKSGGDAAATFFVRAGTNTTPKIYMNGRVQGDRVIIDRIGSLSVEQFIAVCNALFSK